MSHGEHHFAMTPPKTPNKLRGRGCYERSKRNPFIAEQRRYERSFFDHWGPGRTAAPAPVGTEPVGPQGQGLAALVSAR